MSIIESACFAVFLPVLPAFSGILPALPCFLPRPNPWNPVDGFGLRTNGPLCSRQLKFRFIWILAREYRVHCASQCRRTGNFHYRKGYCCHVSDHGPKAVDSTPYLPTIQYACVCFSCTGNNVSLAYLRITFSMLAKCAITGAFSIVYVYVPEIFPTTLRSRWFALLWPPYGIRQAIIFLPCGFFFLSFFFLFSRLISAVGDCMSAILPHMVCP